MSARNHSRLDMAWNQLFLANFGKVPGMEVPDRRAHQSARINMSKTWSGSSPSWSSKAAMQPIPELVLPRPPTTPDVVRPQPDPSMSSPSSPPSTGRDSLEQLQGLTRSSTAPALSRTLSSSSLLRASPMAVTPMTSNQRYGWLKQPEHLAMRPRVKAA